MSIASLIARDQKGDSDLLSMGDLALTIDCLIDGDRGRALALARLLITLRKEAKGEAVAVRDTLGWGVELCFLDSEDYDEARARFEQSLLSEEKAEPRRTRLARRGG